MKRIGDVFDGVIMTFTDEELAVLHKALDILTQEHLPKQSPFRNPSKEHDYLISLKEYFAGAMELTEM